MGIALDIYHLVRLSGTTRGCIHHVLLRVVRPEFSNCDQDAECQAIAVGLERRDQLLQKYQDEVLARECATPHQVYVEGELQGIPIGEVFYETNPPDEFPIWVAETEYGAPWVVLGEAPSEPEFWNLIADDELSSLRPIPPARELRVAYVNDDRSRWAD